jgi:hypothetical protein
VRERGSRAESTASAAATPGRHLAPILCGIGVALVAFAWLDRVNPQFPPTDDGLRDQLLVRDCTELGRCHAIGAPTSVPGFHQGAVWLDLLIAVRLLGGDTSTQRTAVIALLALAVATSFVVVWRLLRPWLALPTAVLLTAALALDPYPGMLINPSPSAFPDVLAAGGLLCYGLSGRRRFLLSSAFALGAGINVHIGSLSLVPALLAIGAAARRRPWLDLLAAIGVLAATCLATSGAALHANAAGLAEHGRLVPALAGAATVVLASAALGSRFRRLSSDGRAWIVGLALILPFGLATAWLVLWQKHPFGLTYAHPVVGPAAALGAALVSLPFGLSVRRPWLHWIPSAASIAAVALLAVRMGETPSLAGPRRASAWTLTEAQAIADRARQRGWSYEELVFRVQGRACRELLTAMSVAAPPPASVRPQERQLQVVKGASSSLAALADPRDVVSLGATEAAVVRDIQSWLRPDASTACRAAPGRERSPACAAANPRAAELASARFLFITRAFPEIHGLDQPLPYTATYEIPLSPVAGQSRDLILTDPAPPDCAWQIARVEGVELSEPLPARRVRLYSDHGAPGKVVVEKPFGAAGCLGEVDRRYPPCLFESEPDDPLQAVVIGS